MTLPVDEIPTVATVAHLNTHLRVGFNARLLSSPSLRGWNRYALSLIAGLAETGVEIYLYSDRPIHYAHLARLKKPNIHVELAPPMSYLRWLEIWLPLRCRESRLSIFHSPFHFGLPWFTHCPCVLTLHDAIGQSHAGGLRNIAKTLKMAISNPGEVINALDHWSSRHRAAHIITVSDYSRRQLESVLEISPRRISVVPEAADSLFHNRVTEGQKQQLREKLDLRQNYFLYLGGWEERKNIPFLLQAFARASTGTTRLVLAGGKSEQILHFSLIAGALGISDRVTLLGFIPDEDLPALYAAALAFVYPSKDEGFGLQLCEAMAAGCALLAARSSSLPEVLGTGGELFGLDSIDELAELLSRLHKNQDFLTELRNRAQLRSRDFSWSTTAKRTLATYKSMLSD